ncbi:MAG: SUMF1/EgtB/PvdO family nonheme iron enzyme [Desulfobacterales bacterium]|nr:SUMF1/EgtB/PvdO family nonheme iron enzyme [Desulfobacterales bacterium]
MDEIKEIINEYFPKYSIEENAIGRGNFGTVYKLKDDLKTRAVKIVRFSSKDDGDLRSIIKYYELIKGSGIVEVFDFFIKETETQSYLLILMEFCEKNLEQKLKEELSAEDINKLMLALAGALERLSQNPDHDRAFLVTDLKPPNLLITQKNELVIGDLGGIKNKGSIDSGTGGQHTPDWGAPEVTIYGKKPTIRSLIFSYGLVSFFMCEKKLPYSEEENFNARLDKIKVNGLKFENNVPRNIKSLIRKCTAYEEKNRYPDFKNIIDVLKGEEKTFQFYNEKPKAGFIKKLIAFSKSLWMNNNNIIIAPNKSPIEGPYGMKFVYISPGTFIMGSPKTEIGRNDDEDQHEVILTKGFYLQTTPVTRGQWKAVFGEDNNLTYFKEGGDDCPVEMVSWNNTQKFISELNRNDSEWVYRLPTEAEWEYAARAGSITSFANGHISNEKIDPNLDKIGWYLENSEKKTHPVANKEPNAWGLYDMHGNVYEWCQDEYAHNYSKISSSIDPIYETEELGSGRMQVARGGSFCSSAQFCRSASRYHACNPYDENLDIGFRLVRTYKQINGPYGMKFVYISPGTFLMGSPSSEKGRVAADEKQHEVTLTQGFYMQTTQVTQRQWKAVMGKENNPSLFKEGRDNYPVENITRENVQKFISKLNQNTEWVYRLPTEAEWEYAARAGSMTAFANGDISDENNDPNLDKMGWYSGNANYKTHPVAQKEPNVWGLYDMHGNVWELCQNEYTSYHILHGGSWNNTASCCRSANRIIWNGLNYADLGFRIIRTYKQIDGPYGMKFVYIRPGTFIMGSPSTEKGRDADEEQHEVTLTKGFYLQTTTVTQRQWKAVMGKENNPSLFKEGCDNCPVENITRENVQKFISKLNQNTDWVYRLPTEAEWEYAARAGSMTAFANGDISDENNDPNLDKMGWYSGNSNGKTHPVENRDPNNWGLYDMHGNVWEFCQDKYTPYAKLLSNIDPIYEDINAHHVLRGGSWFSKAAKYCRSANRYKWYGKKANDLGFRLVKTHKQIDIPYGMKFVYICPGTFIMGSPPTEKGRTDDEKEHEVTLTKGFYMQTTPITQGQWKAVMGNNPSRFEICGDNCPVECVSWHDTQEFIRKLNENSEWVYRLPTEAEWEYAARAGHKTAFANGDITDEKTNPNLDKMGWYTKNSYEIIHPVAEKDPNAWGLYDMHGNVYEWCQDIYTDYFNISTNTDPISIDEKSGSYRVLRGGGWNSRARSCRSANRRSINPNSKDNNFGFRVVRTLK